MIKIYEEKNTNGIETGELEIELFSSRRWREVLFVGNNNMMKKLFQL